MPETGPGKLIWITRTTSTNDGTANPIGKLLRELRRGDSSVDIENISQLSSEPNAPAILLVQEPLERLSQLLATGLTNQSAEELWISEAKQVLELKEKYGDRLLPLSEQALVQNTDKYHKLADRLRAEGSTQNTSTESRDRFEISGPLELLALQMLSREPASKLQGELELVTEGIYPISSYLRSAAAAATPPSSPDMPSAIEPSGALMAEGLLAENKVLLTQLHQTEAYVRDQILQKESREQILRQVKEELADTRTSMRKDGISKDSSIERLENGLKRERGRTERLRAKVEQLRLLIAEGSQREEDMSVAIGKLEEALAVANLKSATPSRSNPKKKSRLWRFIQGRRGTPQLPSA